MNDPQLAGGHLKTFRTCVDGGNSLYGFDIPYVYVKKNCLRLSKVLKERVSRDNLRRRQVRGKKNKSVNKT